MGSPRRLRKKVVGPRHPYDKDRLEFEQVLLGQYGLRNKREIWKAQTRLRSFRTRSRKMLALPEEIQKREQLILMRTLHKLGLVSREDSPLDAVLSLEVEEFLKRRLQTQVVEKGLAKNPHQSRQMIVHGHIAIEGTKTTVPSYHVKLGEEAFIDYSPDSPYADPDHPALTFKVQAQAKTESTS